MDEVPSIVTDSPKIMFELKHHSNKIVTHRTAYIVISKTLLNDKISSITKFLFCRSKKNSRHVVFWTIFYKLSIKSLLPLPQHINI